MRRRFKLYSETLSASFSAFRFTFESVNFFEPLARDIFRNRAGDSVVSRQGVNCFEPTQIFIERVNVAAVKEAVNLPALIEKVRYRDCAVRSAANVKENFFAHVMIITQRVLVFGHNATIQRDSQ